MDESVNIKASIVAMEGKIIPLPLAIAEILIFLLPILHSAYDTFGRVSVVRIDCAALNQTYLL